MIDYYSQAFHDCFLWTRGWRVACFCSVVLNVTFTLMMRAKGSEIGREEPLVFMKCEVVVLCV